MADACATCRFWDVYEGGVYPNTVGDCRRRAPAINDFLLSQALPRNVSDQFSEMESNVYVASAFPVTARGSWCGEFEGREGGA